MLRTLQVLQNVKVAVSIYRSIIQSRLLYGSETWVVSARIILMMETFHRRCWRFLTGDFICKLPCGEWIYPSTAELMKKVGLELIQTYINERKKHVEKHLTDESKPIGDLMNSLNMKVKME